MHTPLVASTSKATTPASPAEDFTLTYLSLVTVISSPPAVFTSVDPTGTSWAVKAAEGTTCRRSTAVRAYLSASRLLKASLGTLAKAALVGANTVKGPSLVRVSTRPAALTAASRVESWGAAMASSAMFLDGAAGARASLWKLPLPIALLLRPWWPGAAEASVRQVRTSRLCMMLVVLVVL